MFGSRARRTTARSSPTPRPIHRGDQRPHKALPAVCGIDEHIEQARASVAPGRSRNGEADERRAIPCGHHHRFAVCGLPAHFTLRERARAPFLALELQHPRTELTPGGGIERDGLDRGHHQRLVTVTTRASPARSLITRVPPPREYWRR